MKCFVHFSYQCDPISSKLYLELTPKNALKQNSTTQCPRFSQWLRIVTKRQQAMPVVNSCVIHVQFFLGLPSNRENGKDTIYITPVDFQRIAPENTILQNFTPPPPRLQVLLNTVSYTFSPYVAWTVKESNFGDFSDPRLSGTRSVYISALLGEWSASRPSSFTPGERAPGIYCTGGWLGPWAGRTIWRSKNDLSLPGIELQPLYRPSRSQSLYRLLYNG
jgi:hypothetical protein